MRAFTPFLLFSFVSFVLASDGYIRSLKILQKPMYSRTSSSTGSASSSEESNDDTVSLEHEPNPFIEACRACNFEAVKALMDTDVNPLRAMDWKPLYGMAATAQSEQCLDVLDLMIYSSKVPQVNLSAALTLAMNRGNVEAFKTIYDRMIQLDYKLSMLMLQELSLKAKPAMLNHVLGLKAFTYQVVAEGIQRTFRMGKVDNFNLLIKRLDEDQVSLLLPGLINSINTFGCPETLEAAFEHEHFKEAAANNTELFLNLTKAMIKKSMKNPTFTEFVKVVDILLQFPLISEVICSNSYLHEAVRQGHVGLGLVLRRRCPHTLKNLKTNYLADAMKTEAASEVFQAFADVFIMAGYDFMEVFLSALLTLDRGLIDIIYKWANANDYFLGLEVRMAVIDLSLEKLSNPEKLMNPTLYDQRRQYLHLAKTKNKELNALQTQLKEDPDNKELVAKIRNADKVIADAVAMVDQLSVDPEIMKSVKYMMRRLQTFVYMEDAPLFKLKEIAKRHDLKRVLAHLNRFSHKPGDPINPDEPEEFDWYQ